MEPDEMQLFVLELELEDKDIKIRNPWYSEIGFRYRLAMAIEGAGVWSTRFASRVAYWVMPDGVW